MNSRKALTMILALLFALAINLPVTRAEEHNQLSTLTFDQPIQIPSASGHSGVEALADALERLRRTLPWDDAG